MTTPITHSAQHLDHRPGKVPERFVTAFLARVILREISLFIDMPPLPPAGVAQCIGIYWNACAQEFRRLTPILFSPN